MIGIYIITNEVNEKCYIGQVGKGKNKTFETRFNEHYKALIKNKHKNKHLQLSWNKYGEDNFTFDILEECNKEELDDKEKYWIAYYQSDNRKYGYNKTKGGEGVIPNEETRKKLSENNAMKRPEMKQKMQGKNNPMYGKHVNHTEETRHKISETLKLKHKEEHPQWITITDEMIFDYKNGIRKKDFLIKYKVSARIWTKVKHTINKAYLNI